VRASRRRGDRRPAALRLARVLYPQAPGREDPDLEGRARGRAQAGHRALRRPQTVQAILAARIDRLSPEDKRLLQSAAVIGKDVPFALLAAIVEEREEELRHALAHLQAAEFLYETSLFPDIEYTFRHGLTLEVAYGSLLQERRRALHARILEVLEAGASDRLGDHGERLAHHALRGGLWDKAVTYHHDVAVKAAQRAAWREAA
jgi:predicted ATPase